MKANERITLSGTQALYLALVILVVIPAIVMVAFQPALQNLWCQQFEIQTYEKALGFKVGSLSYESGSNGKREGIGFTWVDDQSPLGRAGIRAGDFPRMQHGVADLCGELAMVAEGQPASFDVINVADIGKGEAARRRVTINGASP